MFTLTGNVVVVLLGSIAVFRAQEKLFSLFLGYGSSGSGSSSRKILVELLLLWVKEEETTLRYGTIEHVFIIVYQIITRLLFMRPNHLVHLLIYVDS